MTPSTIASLFLSVLDLIESTMSRSRNERGDIEDYIRRREEIRRDLVALVRADDPEAASDEPAES